MCTFPFALKCNNAEGSNVLRDIRMFCAAVDVYILLKKLLFLNPDQFFILQRYCYVSLELLVIAYMVF